MDKLDKLIEIKLQELFEQWSPSPFGPTGQDVGWYNGTHAPSVPSRRAIGIDEEKHWKCSKCGHEIDAPLNVPEAGMGYIKCPNCGEAVIQKEGEELVGSSVKESNVDNLLWTYKMVLLNQLNESQMLKESMTYNQRDNFKVFIKRLTLQESEVIFLRQGVTEYSLDNERNINSITSMVEASPLTVEIEKDRKIVANKVGVQPDKLSYVGVQSLDGVEDGKYFHMWDIMGEPAVSDYKLHSSVVGKKYQKGETLELQQKLGQRLGLPAKIAISVGIATLLAIAGYYIYKRVNDQCRKQCKESDDSECLKKCRKMGTQASLIKLRAQRSSCGADVKCRAKLDKEIKKWEAKARKYS